MISVPTYSDYKNKDIQKYYYEQVTYDRRTTITSR